MIRNGLFERLQEMTRIARFEGTLDSAMEAIGNTPLVKLGRLTKGLSGHILGKLEYLNPGFSKKDRIALQIIEEAEINQQLKPGQTVVELTSGNTGTGLAIVCAIKGYPFVAVMSKGNSTERARMMRALGAEVILVEQMPGSRRGQMSGADLELVEQEAQRVACERKAFRANQFRLEAHVRAHYFHTGPEIIAQTGGRFHAFCDFVGTAGSFAGCSRAFKEYRESTKCYVVEPHGAAVLAGEPLTSAAHRIQGGGYGIQSLPLFSPSDADGYIQVTDEEAIQACRELAKREGIFAGFSSGANVAAAQQLLRGELAGKTVVVLLCDSGLKYLSTDLWE